MSYPGKKVLENGIIVGVNAKPKCGHFFSMPDGCIYRAMETDTGLLQSGYMRIDPDFSVDNNLAELLEDLEVFYRDGKKYCSCIICNDRM